MSNFFTTPRATARVATVLMAAALMAVSAGSRADAARDADPAKSETQPAPKPKLDLSGKERVGKASYYAKHFNGKKMADGTPMNPHRNNAASKTLPLGTTAKVTNLETGQSAVVEIKDRGPYVKGRIVDLSPATAKQVGITEEDGIATVAVTPIEVPLPDGTKKAGEAAK